MAAVPRKRKPAAAQPASPLPWLQQQGGAAIQSVTQQGQRAYQQLQKEKADPNFPGSTLAKVGQFITDRLTEGEPRRPPIADDKLSDQEETAPAAPPRASSYGVTRTSQQMTQRIPRPQPPAAQKGSPAVPYQPRMTDPVSGRKMQKGRPVPAANPAPRDYTQQKTVQPVARIKQTAPLGGPSGVINPSDLGRVRDPNSGAPLRLGQPVPTAYSGGIAARVNTNVGAAGAALGKGLKDTFTLTPPGPKPPRPPAGPTSPRGLSMKQTGGLAGTGKMAGGANATPLAAPGARGAPFTTDLDKVASGMPNTPGYSDFPPMKRSKPPPYPY